MHLWRKKLPSLIKFLEILSVAFSVDDDPRVSFNANWQNLVFSLIRLSVAVFVT